MNTLFISTYDSLITIGLLRNGKLISKLENESVRNHSKLTMPMIKDIINSNNMEIKDINDIIVVNGPGSFTGVRIGVTIAKTLAYTLNISIKTITSLEAIAISGKNSKKIVIVSDLKGKYVGLFDGFNRIDDYMYLSNKEFDCFNKNGYIIEDDTNFNLEKVYTYLKDVKEVNPHSVNPIYVKGIEAIRDK